MAFEEDILCGNEKVFATAMLHKTLKV